MQQPITTLISPEGEWVSPRSPEFLAALGETDPAIERVAFAIKNLGFIRFQVLEQLVLEVELHPRNVALPALLAAQQYILTSTIKLFRIRYLTERWCSEISGTAEKTIDRLSELCTPVFALPSSNRFNLEAKDLSELFKDYYNPMRPLAQKWRAAFGFFDSTVISLAVQYGLLSRLMIAGITTKRSEPTWRFLGEGHKWFGDEYRLQGLGEKVTNMPDKDYGGWATEFYNSVARTGQPRYDIVRGSVQYEDEWRKPLKPVHYERLMLPWRTPSDEIFVTMCSRRFGTDDLPSVDEDASCDTKTSAMSS
jgi:hypothetical protein